MEEGPEPQELMESVEHSAHAKHEGAPSPAHKSKHLKPAIVAATLAVCAAIGSLLSGHAANEAILKQTKASDNWSYYQAKSTKGHLYELNKTLLEALIEALQVESGSTESKVQNPKLKAIIDHFGSKTATYEAEKEKIRKEAEDLKKESAQEFEKHQIFSFAVACFQIGIVVASVSILIDSNVFLLSSVGVGLIGILLLVYGYVHT